MRHGPSGPGTGIKTQGIKLGIKFTSSGNLKNAPTFQLEELNFGPQRDEYITVDEVITVKELMEEPTTHRSLQ